MLPGSTENWTLGHSPTPTICEAIKDLYARNVEEFLLLPDGNEIRLDQLVSVGGKLLKTYC